VYETTRMDSIKRGAVPISNGTLWSETIVHFPLLIGY
jgi:hypothetical protein